MVLAGVVLVMAIIDMEITAGGDVLKCTQTLAKTTQTAYRFFVGIDKSY